MAAVVWLGMIAVVWSGTTAVMWSGTTAVMWAGMMTVLKTGAEITMLLSLGMMLSMDEILLVGKVQVLLCVFL